MSKVSKFFVHPIQFWVDFFGERNKVVGNYGKTIFAFHINDWKIRFISPLGEIFIYEVNKRLAKQTNRNFYEPQGEVKMPFNN